MAAVVEVDAGQAAKRNKATDEEGRTPAPAPQQPVGPLRKHRQPTPDHPPYCWMIGEAIDELCENGGSEEDSISAFIRARYPGVPAAHDRLLRHYLDKHVAEGFFVRTAAGRYLRSPEEYTVVERPVELAAAASSELACVGSPVAEAKRGRGRPRKDGSSLTSPAGKKDGARSASPKRRGRRRPAIGLCTDEDSDPASLAAVADKKDGNQAASLTPRRLTLRRAAVQLIAAGDYVPTSPVAVADKKDGSQAASSTPKRRGGSSSTSPAGKKDGARSSSPKGHGRRRAAIGLDTDEDSDPAALAAACSNKQDGSQAASLTPRRRTLRRAAVQMSADEDSVPTSPVAVADKKDGSQAASSTPKRRGRLRRLGMVATTTDSSGKAPVASEENGSEVPYLTDKEHEPPRELALVIVSDGPATASIMGKVCAEAPPTKALDGGQPLELALVSTTDVPVPVPAATAAMDDKEAGGDAPSFNLALVPTNGGICTTTTAPEFSSQPCEPVAGSVSVLVADKDGVEEAPSATNKRVHQPRNAGSAPGKKAGGEALSATPKDHRGRRKAAAVATDHSARTPVAGKKAGRMASSASPKLTPVTASGMEAHKLYPVTADEIDPECILLALPSLAPAVAKA